MELREYKDLCERLMGALSDSDVAIDNREWASHNYDYGDDELEMVNDARRLQERATAVRRHASMALNGTTDYQEMVADLERELREIEEEYADYRE